MATVIVGLSGGVDSAVSAYLLQQQGYTVIGAFMRNWDSLTNQDVMGNPHIFDDVCPQEVDYQDAKQVADHLGIPLLRIDFIEQYWQHVFAYFIEEYKKGRTPNPDVLCNKYIKFDAFLDFAKAQGADFIAMGHYAQIRHEDGHSLLLKGTDPNKDQSYFLCLLKEEQISKTLFPVGHLLKSEVRQIAEKIGLPVAKKKDSTGICFIGERDFRQFLENYIPAKPGPIKDIKTNQIIGNHRGVMYYTIGQRKGLGVGGIKDHESGSWFVIDKDLDKSILWVSQGDENEFLMSSQILVDDVHWIHQPNQDKFSCSAKFRYRQKDVPITVFIEANHQVKVVTDVPVKAITPGQICVFYQGEVCLGGGTIDHVIKETK